MKIGYARTSTSEQVAGLEAQIKELEAAGCERVYSEQVSSVAQHRPQFEFMLATLRPGDVVICTKLDRLARSMGNLHQIVETLQKGKVGLKFLSGDMDTETAQGKLMVNVLGSFAQFEREIMKERQRDGVAKAKAEGKYKGRKKTFADDRAVALRSSGRSLQDIAEELGVTRQAVHKRLKKVSQQATA